MHPATKPASRHGAAIRGRHLAAGAALAVGFALTAAYAYSRTPLVAVLVPALGAAASALLAAAVLLALGTRDRATRHAAEMSATLRESERRFRDLAATAPADIWESGPDLVPAYVGRPDLDGDADVHPDDLERCRAARCAALEGAAPVRSEYRVRAADGAERWVLETLRARRDAAGVVVGCIGCRIDITEQKEALAAARRAESFLQTVIDFLPTPVWARDESRRHLLANRAVRRMYGWPDAGLLDFDDAAMFGPERAAEIAAEERALLDGRLERVSSRHPSAAPGTRGRWIQRVKAAATLADGRRVVLGAIHDIEDLKCTEERLRESEQLLRSIVEAVPAAVSYVGADMRFVWANRREAERSGIPQARFEGLPVEEVATPERHGVIRERIERALAGEALDLEEDRTDRDGAVRRYRQLVVPDRDEKGTVRGLTRLHFDVTEQRAAEAALRESERNLALVADNMPALMARYDAQEVCRFANRRYGERFGTRPERLVGRTLAEILTPAMYAASAPARAAMAAGRAFSYETREETPTSRGRVFEITMVPDTTAGPAADGWFLFAIDITERHESAQALRARERELRMVADNLPALVARIDRDDVCRFANTRFAARFGHTPESIVGRPLAALMSPEQHAMSETQRAAARAGEIVRFESCGDTAFESGRTYDITLVPDRTAGGAPEGAFVLGVDVTEKRAIERAVAERERQLSVVVEHVPAMIAVIGADEVYRFANTLYAEAFGETPESLVGRHTADLFDAATQRANAPLYRRVLAGETVRVERVLARPGGRRIFDVTLVPNVVNDTVDGWFSFTTDVTERRESELRIERSEQRLRRILDTALDAVVQLDGDGRIIGWNAQAERTYGWSAAEAVGQPVTELVAPRGLASRDSTLAQFFTRREAALLDRLHEVRTVDREGREIPVELAMVPVETAQGVEYCAFLRDIRRRRRAELELARHRDNLREIVERRTAELFAEKERAEAANRAKSEFLANMSHELRTPMHAILSFAALGAERSAGATASRVAHYFARIQSSGERLLGLLNDLLDLSKLEAGRMTLECGLHDVATVVQEAAHECEALAHGREVRLLVRPAGRALRAWCDPLRIAQVARNLLWNGIKFTPPGGTVEVSVGPAPLDPAAGDEAEGVAITVTDDGVGIPQDELDSVFEKFAQSSVTKSGAGGTGLGLAISREIVERHGGRIRAERNVPCGARFTVVLPAAAPAALERT